MSFTPTTDSMADSFGVGSGIEDETGFPDEAELAEPEGSSPAPALDEPRAGRRPRKPKGGKVDEPRAGRRRTVSTERRIVDRTLAVAALTDLESDLLAAVCGGSDTEVAELTLACLAAEATAIAALELILEVAGADALSAGAIAAGAISDRTDKASAPAWAALRRLSAALPAQVPSKAVVAGVAFATAAQALGESELAAVRTLVEVLSAGAAG
jgi:hypothetical protein